MFHAPVQTKSVIESSRGVTTGLGARRNRFGIIQQGDATGRAGRGRVLRRRGTWKRDANGWLNVRFHQQIYVRDSESKGVMQGLRADSDRGERGVLGPRALCDSGPGRGGFPGTRHGIVPPVSRPNRLERRSVRISSGQRPEERIDLELQGLETGFVAEHRRRRGRASCPRATGRPRGTSGPRRSSRGCATTRSSRTGARRIDEHDQVAEPVPAGLEQDRRVEHDERHGPSPDLAGDRSRSNSWRIRGWTIASRSRSAAGSAKTIEPRSAAIDPVFLLAGSRGGTEDLGAEPRDDLVAHVGQLEHLVSHRVGVDHARPSRLQQSGHPALARCRCLPIRPITGIAPCFQRRGVGSGREIARDEDDMGLLATRTCGS